MGDRDAVSPSSFPPRVGDWGRFRRLLIPLKPNAHADHQTDAGDADFSAAVFHRGTHSGTPSRHHSCRPECLESASRVANEIRWRPGVVVVQEQIPDALQKAVPWARVIAPLRHAVPEAHRLCAQPGQHPVPVEQCLHLHCAVHHPSRADFPERCVHYDGARDGRHGARVCCDLRPVRAECSRGRFPR